MKSPTDILPPAPTNSTPDKRAMSIGGVNFLVNGRHGGFVANQLDYYVGFAMVRYGEHCENEWNLLRQLITPGSNVAVIGANIGSHVVPLAKHLGADGRVIAVEPQRIVHQYLCANLAMNSLANVETHSCGCGERNNIMAVPPLNYFSEKRSDFSNVALVKEGEGESVVIRTFDEIAGARMIHFMKIDVSGMEAEVIRGAKRTLKRCRPLLYVANENVEKSPDLIKQLRHYGYRLYWHYPPLFNPLNFFEEGKNIYGITSSINMVCVPEGHPMDMRNFKEVGQAHDFPVQPALVPK